MLRLYRGLLLLYPAAYRLEFGDEMTCVFLQAQSDVARRRILARFGFSLREVSGLMLGALRAHAMTMLGLNWIPFRRFSMRPGFRFPRSTVFLMWVILAGLVLAIDKAKLVVDMKEGLPPGTSAGWGPMLGPLLLAIALVLAAAAAVWGVLFALHRSGTHRLSQVQTWPESH